jgi:O-acetylhomoserine/O-acetylserine sulfhydrylase-like pyridoxal-dependent enzyme
MENSDFQIKGGIKGRKTKTKTKTKKVPIYMDTAYVINK